MRMVTAANLPMVQVRPQPAVNLQKVLSIKAKKVQAVHLTPLLAAKAKKKVLHPPD